MWSLSGKKGASYAPNVMYIYGIQYRAIHGNHDQDHKHWMHKSNQLKVNLVRVKWDLSAWSQILSASPWFPRYHGLGGHLVTWSVKWEIFQEVVSETNKFRI